MTIMDPWTVNGHTLSTTAISDPLNNNLSFEDNFTFASTITNEPLPDSQQYLATLEAKLRKIKNDPNVLKQLQEKREACMQNLMNSTQFCEIDDDLDEPLNNSHVFRTIMPQKQALNRGELVELLNYDQLEEISSENDVPKTAEAQN